MRKAILSILGGAVFCLSIVLYSCGNIENPLEKIVSAPYYAPLTDALKDNAKVVVEYTLFGDLQAKQLEFTFDGGLEQFSEIATPVAPADQNYTLKPVLDYDQNKGEIIFTLIASPKNIETRLGDGDGDGDGEDEPSDKKVLVVVFDVKAQTYKVAGLPGFSFKVLKIEGYEADVKNAWPEKAEVALKKVVSDDEDLGNGIYKLAYIEGMDNYPFVVNYEKGKTWSDVIGYYSALLNEEYFIKAYGPDYNETYSRIIIDPSSYDYVYSIEEEFTLYPIDNRSIVNEEEFQGMVPVQPENEIVLPIYVSVSTP